MTDSRTCSARKLSPGGMRMLMVLAGLTASAPLATDMYLPGLPEMTQSLRAAPWELQLSLTGFLAGVVVGQFVLGPLSDRVGRRKVLLGGGVGFALFSLVAAAAPAVEVLNAARLLQGAAGAAGLVVTRAVVTDCYDDRESVRAFAMLGAISSAGPILAPLAGGAVLAIAPWRAVFAVLALFGAVLVVGIVRWVPESLPSDRRSPGSLGSTFAVMGRLIRRPRLAGLVLARASANAAIFAYLTGASFVFTLTFGFSAAATSLVFGVNAFGCLIGSLLCGYLVNRVSLRALLWWGLATASAAAITLTVAALLTDVGALLTGICLFVSIFAFSVFFPAVTAAAQNLGREAPGATSALLGCTQFLIGAAASPLVGALGATTVLPMAGVMAGCLVLALLTIVVVAASVP